MSLITSYPISRKLTGSGNLQLKGAFNIDLTGAVAAHGNAWTLVDAGTLSETYDASFAVSGFSQSSNIWTKPAGAGTWTFTEASGILSYSATASFSTWIAGYTVGADNEPGDDFDKDGINNLLEHALNGHPAASDAAVLPDLVVTATTFEFSYFRRDLSLADTAQSFHYGSDLAGWTSLLIPTGPGVSTVGIATVTITDSGSTDFVKVSIPKSTSSGGKLFGYLQVTQ